MTSTFEIQNFKKINRRKQKLLNCKPWHGQMKFLNNAGYQSTVGSLLKYLCNNTLKSIPLEFKIFRKQHDFIYDIYRDRIYDIYIYIYIAYICMRISETIGNF